MPIGVTISRVYGRLDARISGALPFTAGHAFIPTTLLVYLPGNSGMITAFADNILAC